MVKEKKSEKKEKFKSKECVSCEKKKIEAWVKMKGKWAKKMIYAHNF